MANHLWFSDGGRWWVGRTNLSDTGKIGRCWKRKEEEVEVEVEVEEEEEEEEEEE
jgi:hypothetical protein